MDKKSKIMIFLFFMIAVVSVILTYYKIMIKKDYLISAEADCDPETEECFTRTCDPKIDETCSDDPNERVFYYKMVKKNYGKIVDCDSQRENCPNFSCDPGEADCEEIFCNETNVTEGESCNDPKVYLPENSEELNSKEGSDESENSEDSDLEAGYVSLTNFGFLFMV